MHVNVCRSGHVHADFRGVIHPDTVLNDFRVQASVAEFLRDVIGSRFVLGRAGDMGSLGKNAEMLLSEFRVGHREELAFLSSFRGRIAKAKDCRGGLGSLRRLSLGKAQQ